MSCYMYIKGNLTHCPVGPVAKDVPKGPSYHTPVSRTTALNHLNHVQLAQIIYPNPGTAGAHKINHVVVNSRILINRKNSCPAKTALGKTRQQVSTATATNSEVWISRQCLNFTLNTCFHGRCYTNNIRTSNKLDTELDQGTNQENHIPYLTS